MKSFFPGYFTPTEEEFSKLWTDCLFGFDANVLLGLYRSTAETQQVFFSVLKKIADRIFLPHQAAAEYLRNRLGVISIRSDSYGKISSESEKLAKFVESIVQEHALPNGKGIVTTAKGAAEKIRDLVEAASQLEPDLLKSDDLLAQLVSLFETKTGPPYDQQRLKEIYGEAAQRYSMGIPPGYKDDKKGEPDKYGDVLIWFQLIDLAKLEKKPIIFVTGDAKEDWWQQHRSQTLGPRPELRQEMMAVAGVHFYMYTTPRFLEFAKRFLGLSLDTTKAESEFEKIEKQDKQAAEWSASEPERYYNYTYAYSPANYQMNPGYALGAPVNTTWWTQDSDSAINWTKPVDAKRKNRLFSLLPINGHVYQSSHGKWKCEILREPDSEDEDRACYILKFERLDVAAKPRNLKLWISLRGLERDSDWRYTKAISRIIVEWLEGNQSSGEIAFFA